MRRVVLVCGVLIGVLAAPREALADISVSIQGNDFVPGIVTIAPGETVRWTHNDGQAGHNVSLPGAFRSEGMYEGESFSYTFSEAGTYSYGCSLHPTLMSGTVVVGAASVPDLPTPAIPAAPPAAVATVAAPATETPVATVAPVTATPTAEAPTAVPPALPTPVPFAPDAGSKEGASTAEEAGGGLGVALAAGVLAMVAVLAAVGAWPRRR